MRPKGQHWLRIRTQGSVDFTDNTPSMSRDPLLPGLGGMNLKILLGIEKKSDKTGPGCHYLGQFVSPE